MQDTYSVYFDNNTCYIGISKSQVLLLCKIKKVQRELDKHFEDFNNHIKEKYDNSSLINENEINSEIEYFKAGYSKWSLEVAKQAYHCVLPINHKVIRIKKEIHNIHGVGYKMTYVDEFEEYIKTKDAIIASSDTVCTPGTSDT